MSELTRLAALDQLPAAGRSIEIVADRAERESVARRLELVSLARLEARPSYARVLSEAEPFFGYFPLDPKPRVGATA